MADSAVGRRAILVALLQLPLGHIRSSLALFSFAALLIHIIARPYKRPIANHLESVTLVSCVLGYMHNESTVTVLIMVEVGDIHTRYCAHCHIIHHHCHH
jgi:hypothetical protein